VPTGTPASASTARNVSPRAPSRASTATAASSTPPLRSGFLTIRTTPSHVRRLVGTDGLPPKDYDTIIQGRGRYDVALREGLTSPYAHLREYVASRTLKESPDPNVEIISDDLVGRVRELKAEDGELGIYLCGGSVIAGELLDEIDELIIKTYPVVQSTGMPMFGSGFALTEFTLDDVRGFGNGVVVRKYSRKR
jgi:dihydrofolate reductase